MKKEITEKSKQTKIDYSNKWNREKTKYNLSVRIRDESVAEFIENKIKNKTEFVNEAIKQYINKLKHA